MNESPVPIPDDKADAMSDWIANLLDQFGAYHARMMFGMLPDGDGNPVCSYCGSPNMFCGRTLGARCVRAGRCRASRYLHHSRQIHSP